MFEFHPMPRNNSSCMIIASISDGVLVCVADWCMKYFPMSLCSGPSGLMSVLVYPPRFLDEIHISKEGIYCNIYYVLIKHAIRNDIYLHRCARPTFCTANTSCLLRFNSPVQHTCVVCDIITPSERTVHTLVPVN